MPFDDCAELADDEPGIGIRGEGGSGATTGEGGGDGPDLDDWGEGDYDDADDDGDYGPRADGAGSAWDRAENPAPRGRRPCNIAPEIRLGETMPATTALRREWDKIRDLDSDLVERWTMRMGRPGRQPRAEVCGAPSTDFRSMVLTKALKGRIAADSLGRILDLEEGAIQRLDHGQIRSIADVFDEEKALFIAVMRWAELLEEAFRARPGFRADKNASKKRQSRRRKFLSSTWPQITDLKDPERLTPHDDEVQHMLDSIQEEIRARVSLAHVRSRLADARLAGRVQEALDAWIPFDDGRARHGVEPAPAGSGRAGPGRAPAPAKNPPAPAKNCAARSTTWRTRRPGRMRAGPSRTCATESAKTGARPAPFSPRPPAGRGSPTRSRAPLCARGPRSPAPIPGAGRTARPPRP